MQKKSFCFLFTNTLYVTTRVRWRQRWIRWWGGWAIRVERVRRRNEGREKQTLSLCRLPSGSAWPRKPIYYHGSWLRQNPEIINILSGPRWREWNKEPPPDNGRSLEPQSHPAYPLPIGTYRKFHPYFANQPLLSPRSRVHCFCYCHNKWTPRRRCRHRRQAIIINSNLLFGRVRILIETKSLYIRPRVFGRKTSAHTHSHYIRPLMEEL